MEAMQEEAREQMILAALGDKNSAYYKGIVKLLRDSDASARRAKMMKRYVTIPFQVSDVDLVELEEQFSVPVRVKGAVMRAGLVSRVAAMVHVLESALVEHAMVGGRTALLIDGDLMSVAATGLDGKLVERTHASPRLASGYFMEDEHLRKFAEVTTGDIGPSADRIRREQVAGGGEHFWPVVRSEGPAVDVVVVNHFKTPVGPRQVAKLALCRQASAIGAFPFQTEMLLRSKGRTACFPGWFYVDEESDTLTLVPDADATLSMSHPYSSLMEIVKNNSVTVEGTEFLCEKYMSVKGIMYYSLKAVEAEFDMPEVLRTNYYDTTALGVTVLCYPKVKLSVGGVPVGFTRGEVRIMSSRCATVLSRLMTSANAVVSPAEAFTALMDYNNMVFTSLDTATVADRMSVEDEEGASLALALHVNWRRHAARGTFNVLMDAIKLRYKVKDLALHRLAYVALAAWWSRPSVGKSEADGIPVQEVVDWCGNDFSVTMAEVDPWIEIAQEVGLKAVFSSRQFSWFPRVRPDRSDDWFTKVCEKALRMFRGKEFVRPKMPGEIYGKSGISEAKLSAVCVDRTEVQFVPPPVVLTELKERLLKKMMKEQGASRENAPEETVEVISQVRMGPETIVPVVDVEPISAIQHDVDIIVGPINRDAAASGYRLAEVEVDKVTRGNLAVNDAKRGQPKAKWLRRPMVDVGVEGVRAASQSTLLGAVFKRNVGIPSNRGTVDLELVPKQAVDKIIQVCYRDGWEDIVARHLDTGMWDANQEDLESFLGNIDERKAKVMLDEFFMEGTVNLQKWLMMAKGKVKPSREEGAEVKVDHAQTILYLENSSTNAMYSSMVRRFKRCVNECMRAEVKLNAQESDEEHEDWYNSLEPLRQSLLATYSYAADIKCYDRSQEHVALRVDLEFYRRHGLDAKRLKIWEQTHGPKRAVSMMFGVVLMMALGGVSGIFKTLLRNGIVNLAALLVSTDMQRKDVVMIDIKGDDLDLEVARPLAVETSVERMSLTFNFSAKFFTNNVRYMCKQFRIKKGGRWYFVADPWARVQSLCTPIVVGGKDDSLVERWESMRSDLRHYDNGLLVDEVAEVAQQYYHTSKPLYGFARGLAKLVSDRGSFFKFFKVPERVC